MHCVWNALKITNARVCVLPASLCSFFYCWCGCRKFRRAALYNYHLFALVRILGFLICQSVCMCLSWLLLLLLRKRYVAFYVIFFHLKTHSVYVTDYIYFLHRIECSSALFFRFGFLCLSLAPNLSRYLSYLLFLLCLVRLFFMVHA